MADQEGPVFAVYCGGRAKPQPETEVVFTPEEDGPTEDEAAVETALQELRTKFEWMLRNCDNVIIIGVTGDQVDDVQPLIPDRHKTLGILGDAYNSYWIQGRHMLVKTTE